MNQSGKLEPIVTLLFVGLFISVGLLFVCEHFYANDGQMFQVIAGIVGNFTGALFMRVKPRSSDSGELQPKTMTVSAPTESGGPASATITEGKP